jgi:hypothetical protein
MNFSGGKEKEKERKRKRKKHTVNSKVNAMNTKNTKDRECFKKYNRLMKERVKKKNRIKM